jgi:hypothetical protein
MAKLNLYPVVISRYLSQVNPVMYREIEEAITPMLSDTAHIPALLQAVRCQHPNFDETDTRILFTACVYEIYCPASFLPKAAMRLPVGIRDEMARVLGYGNPENINSWKGIADAYMKGKSFRSRVDAIKDEFRCFSVRAQDWELKLV